jgi:hypothetical protein
MEQTPAKNGLIEILEMKQPIFYDTLTFIPWFDNIVCLEALALACSLQFTF